MTDHEPHFPPTGAGSPRTLRRCPHRRLVAGVAAGLGGWLGVEVLYVRLALVCLALVGGLAVPLYLAAWVLIPEEGAETSIAEDLLGRPLRV